MTQPGDGTQSGAPGVQSGSESNGGSNDGNTGQSAGTNGQETQNGQQVATVTQAEFDAIKRQLQAADQNRSRAELEAKALRDAQLSEEEKRKQALDETAKKLAEREAEVKTLKLQNAFVTDNTYDWHDPKAALKLADLSAVEISDDGTVKGLKEALKAVADANPWMIKPKTGAETPGDNNGGAGSTGAAGQGSGAGTGNASKANLEKRFPMMKGRVS